MKWDHRTNPGRGYGADLSAAGLPGLLWFPVASPVTQTHDLGVKLFGQVGAQAGTLSMQEAEIRRSLQV